jgi:hypothetical protein
MYRRTKKVTESRARQLAAMRKGKERARMQRDTAPDPQDLPDLRMRITVERFDFGPERHVFELRKTRRVDTYAVLVDGQPWKRAGLTAVLEGVRKSCPRVLSVRAAE